MLVAKTHTKTHKTHKNTKNTKLCTHQWKYRMFTPSLFTVVIPLWLYGGLVVVLASEPTIYNRSKIIKGFQPKH